MISGWLILWNEWLFVNLKGKGEMNFEIDMILFVMVIGVIGFVVGYIIKCLLEVGVIVYVVVCDFVCEDKLKYFNEIVVSFFGEIKYF